MGYNSGSREIYNEEEWNEKDANWIKVEPWTTTRLLLYTTKMVGELWEKFNFTCIGQQSSRQGRAVHRSKMDQQKFVHFSNSPLPVASGPTTWQIANPIMFYSCFYMKYWQYSESSTNRSLIVFLLHILRYSLILLNKGSFERSSHSL